MCLQKQTLKFFSKKLSGRANSESGLKNCLLGATVIGLSLGGWLTFYQWSNGPVPANHSLTNSVVDRPWFWGRGLKKHHLPITSFCDVPHVEPEKVSPQVMEPRGY